MPPVRRYASIPGVEVLTVADVLANRGGLELLQYELCSQLAARGHGVRVVHRAGGDLEEAWRRFAREVRPVPEVVLGRRLGRSSLRFARGVVPSGRIAADVVYVHYYEHLELAWLAARGGRRPIVGHLHLRGPAGLGRFGRRLVRAADRYVAGSAAIADGWAAAGVPRHRIAVVPNGVDTDVYTPAPPGRVAALRAARGIPDDAFVVVFAGRMVPHKGVGVLMEAVGRLRTSHPGATLLVVAGGGPLPGHLPGNLQDGVRHLGHVARADVVPLLQLADVVAVPTVEFDGAPLVVAEALACGVPVVASEVGGIPEQLGGRLAEWLVPPGRPDPLAQRLGSLVGWRAHRPEVADRCRARAVEGLSRRRMVDGVERVLEEAVAAGRPGRG